MHTLLKRRNVEMTVFFKNVHGMKGKERLRNCSRLKEAKVTNN